MNIDRILKNVGLRKRSLSEKVNQKVMGGYKPSNTAKKVSGKVSAHKFNVMMISAKGKAQSFKDHRNDSEI
ncbi:hypothetical protein [Cobetia crustatorum]|uniref:hypothetical protein n=1 Tax=Cobetia crustatorum TaxID=553385 RepID=UPI0012EBB505|nr:hypothetical protein [Cobetia crustatorum]